MIQIDNLKKLFQFSNIASRIIEPMLVLSFFVAIYGRFDSSGTKALLKFLHLDPQHTLLFLLKPWQSLMTASLYISSYYFCINDFS